MSVAIKSIQIRPAKDPAKARRLRARVVISPYGVRSMSITPLGLGRLLFPIIAREGLSIRLRQPYRLTLPKGVRFVGRSKEAREARKRTQPAAPAETETRTTRIAKKRTQPAAPAETTATQFSPPDEITSGIFGVTPAEAVTTKRRRTARKKSKVAS